MNEFELDFIKKINLQYFLYSKKEREKKKEKKNHVKYLSIEKI
jgi:hypothetical protein